MARSFTLYTYFTILFSDPLFTERLEDARQRFVFMMTSVACTGMIVLGIDTALAQPAAKAVVTVSVQTSDFDLSRPAGRKILAGRISSAERKICGSGMHGIEAKVAKARCIKSLRRETFQPD
jgi:UrcA family protein